jgi:hypothetical protein
MRPDIPVPRQLRDRLGAADPLLKSINLDIQNVTHKSTSHKSLLLRQPAKYSDNYRISLQVIYHESRCPFTHTSKGGIHPDLDQQHTN